MIRVFVEGPADRAILERLLADLRQTHSFALIAADGRDAARPLARKYLLTTGDRIALVFYTDSNRQDAAKDQERALHSYFSWNAQEDRFCLVPFSPSIEAIFFEEPAALERVLQRELSSAERVAGRYAPREMLRDLAQSNPSAELLKLVDSLEEGELVQLRNVAPVKKLREFICRG